MIVLIKINYLHCFCVATRHFDTTSDDPLEFAPATTDTEFFWQNTYHNEFSFQRLKLYEVRVSKEIAPDYNARISNFTKAFDAVHQLHSLPETLKIHILKSHVGDYLSLSGVTCWSNSDEMVETCHQLLDRRHRKHQTKKTKNLVGAHKEKMSKFVFNTFNAKGLRSKN